MPIWLLTGLGAVRKALAALFAIVLKYPWQALCIVLLLFGAWQTRSLHRTRDALSACESGRKDDRASYVAAQQEALRRALAAKAAQEADYRSKAERADDAHKAELADVRSADDRYIASHRVRYQAPASAAGGPVASAGHRDPGLSESVPDSGLVAVADADVRACSSATAYALAAHNWALSLAK